MIDVKELRVGNIVYIEMPMLPTWQYHRIKGQDIADIENGAIGKIGVINIHPVPLTPELLEKCGFFTNNAKTMYMVKFGEEDTLITLNYYRGEFRTSFYNIHIQYVHQLLNMYRVITGNELNVDI